MIFIFAIYAVMVIYYAFSNNATQEKVLAISAYAFKNLRIWMELL